MKVEKVEADVLCVGGGIAGLLAAIRASELGAKVIIAEKGNSLRSGAGATGNDHFLCYIPEVHGQDIEQVIQEFQNSPWGAMSNASFLRTWLKKSFAIVKLWDSWGIPMKYKGRYEFAGHALPGHPLMWLKYAGQNQKPILTKEARKRGAEIMNRVMVFDLLADSGVIGAIGISTRQNKMIEFQAKSVVLGTGACVRLYPSPVPGWMFNLSSLPNATGDGRAMAYRIGAELVNMELPVRWAGPKYFARAGKATWVGILRDPQGNPVGPFLTKPDRRYGDVTSDIYTTMFEDFAKSGKGPVYMDCEGTSQDDFEYMMFWLKHEGNTALVRYLNEENIDPRRNPIEFMTYELRTGGGIHYNEKGEASVKGLYAAGDEFRSSISRAAVFGWIAGENAAKYAKSVEHPNIEKERAKIEERKILFQEIRSRETGANWREANVALQQIMYDHAGSIRSESLLKAGRNYLRRLKEKVYATMRAENQHELVRCLEVLNLLDLGEIVFVSANERKETRGRHIRPDYPFTNPMLNKYFIIKQVDGELVTEWKEI